MRYLYTITTLLIALLFTSCRATKIHHHPPTEDALVLLFSRQKLPDDVFKTYSKFVDDGILFVPQPREIAWPGSHRSFVRMVSSEPRAIHVVEVTAGNKHGKVKLLINKTFKLREIHARQYVTTVPTRFVRQPKASKVLTHKDITMEVRYFIGDVAGEGTRKSMKFKLKNTREWGLITDYV